MKILGRTPSFARNFIGIVFAMVVASSLLSSCSFDKEEVLYPSDPLAGCDTLGVSFATDVLPIISTQCLICHSMSTATAGVVLEQYSDVQPYATSGRLVQAVEYNSTIKMPQTGKLPDCDIAKIRTWVRDGALDN